VCGFFVGLGLRCSCGGLGFGCLFLFVPMCFRFFFDFVVVFGLFLFFVGFWLCLVFVLSTCFSSDCC